MNVEQSKQIPIQEVAERIGAKKSHERKNEIWYFSPWRDEKTASFKVDTNKNTFIDFATGNGQGSVVDLIIDHNGQSRTDKQAVSAALKALEEMSFIPFPKLERRPYEPKEQVYKLIGEPSDISRRSKYLIDEIARRNVPMDIVMKYFKQGYVENLTTKKKFNCFAFENDSGGWELNNYIPHKEFSFKNCIGHKDITTFKGQDTAYVFSGSWDFLTWLAIKGESKAEYVITNTDSLARKAGEYLLTRKEKINKVIYFKDHDTSGDTSEAVLADILHEHFEFGSMDHLYDGFKDLSAARIARSTINPSSSYKAHPAPKFKP